MTARKFLALALCFVLAQAVAAQDDAPTTLPINYGDRVQGEITDRAFYDWWQIEADAGDEIIAEMTASGGLQPLMGLLTSTGSLITRSEDGEPDGLVELVYTIPETGLYTLVATRVGNADGTSTGSYVLTLSAQTAADVRLNPYEQAVFVCGSTEVATAASLLYPISLTPGQQEIRVYGLDGFQPVIRVYLELSGVQDCVVGEGNSLGDTFTFPGEAPVTVSEGAATAAMTLDYTDQIGSTFISIASADTSPGRYIAVITGFEIEDGSTSDYIAARLGPLAAESTSLLVYMVAVDSSRLDPSVSFSDIGIVCDDAGRRGCEDVPSINGAGVVLNTGVSVIGDRFDAGLRIPVGELAPQNLELRSFRGNTTGEYALIVIGEMPTRTLGN